MNNINQRFGVVAAMAAALLLAACGPTTKLGTSRSYTKGFLNDYSRLQPRGKDMAYQSADAMKVLAAARGVMVDQPEIHIAPGSNYTGAKPADLAAIAEAMRSDISAALKASGYNVVSEPGPNILLLRTALTDVYLEKKERNVLGYTPIGFVVTAGISAVQEVMEKVDIMGMTLQAEITDSKTNAVVFQLVAQRGGNEQRITFEQFQDQMRTWGKRLNCQINNSKLPQAQWADCSALGSTG
ncbi:MAG: DUF3313 domain-containing protein [Gammaproteobacteria bacterium]|nr:MAG: DUF3313 domain-containing protein [Gammaproteobacteria bacterium]